MPKTATEPTYPERRGFKPDSALAQGEYLIPSLWQMPVKTVDKNNWEILVREDSECGAVQLVTLVLLLPGGEDVGV